LNVHWCNPPFFRLFDKEIVTSGLRIVSRDAEIGAS